MDRCQVLLWRGQARVLTRNGYDWSDRYPSIIRAASHLPCHSAIIDGEAILPKGDGASDFEAFQSVGTDRDRRTGALRALLAHPNSEGLNYAGAAFIALGDDERTEFLAEVERLTTSWSAFKSSRLTDAKWCEPRLMVRVKHLAGSKTLRHATVRELVS